MVLRTLVFDTINPTRDQAFFTDPRQSDASKRKQGSQEFSDDSVGTAERQRANSIRAAIDGRGLNPHSGK